MIVPCHNEVLEWRKHDVNIHAYERTVLVRDFAEVQLWLAWIFLSRAS